MSGGVALRALAVADYDAAHALWAATPGVGLSSADAREAIAAFLERNPGLSVAAEDRGRLVGTALCGHDGRRGYIHHLSVAPSHRRRGLARALVAQCVAGLDRAGIQKCHVFVLADNAGGRDFWHAEGWTERSELCVYSQELARGELRRGRATAP